MKTFARKTLYVYEINGKEKITVTSEEEARRWDRIFSQAERLDELLVKTPPELKLSDEDRATLALWMAQHGEALGEILGTGAAETPREQPAAAASPQPVAMVRKQPFVQEFKRPVVPPSKDGFSL